MLYPDKHIGRAVSTFTFNCEHKLKILFQFFDIVPYPMALKGDFSKIRSIITCVLRSPNTSATLPLSNKSSYTELSYIFFVWVFSRARLSWHTTSYVSFDLIDGAVRTASRHVVLCKCIDCERGTNSISDIEIWFFVFIVYYIAYESKLIEKYILWNSVLSR